VNLYDLQELPTDEAATPEVQKTTITWTSSAICYH
jgi:hypothetical protein